MRVYHLRRVALVFTDEFGLLRIDAEASRVKSESPARKLEASDLDFGFWELEFRYWPSSIGTRGRVPEHGAGYRNAGWSTGTQCIFRSCWLSVWDFYFGVPVRELG